MAYQPPKRTPLLNEFDIVIRNSRIQHENKKLEQDDCIEIIIETTDGFKLYGITYTKISNKHIELFLKPSSKWHIHLYYNYTDNYDLILTPIDDTKSNHKMLGGLLLTDVELSKYKNHTLLQIDKKYLKNIKTTNLDEKPFDPIIIKNKIPSHLDE